MRDVHDAGTRKPAAGFNVLFQTPTTLLPIELGFGLAPKEKMQKENDMPIGSLTRSLMVAALVVGGHQLCTAPTANAQAQLPGVQAPVMSDIPDQKLDAAATAMVAVDRVQQEYREKLKGIAEEANKAAEKAVTDQGLSVDEFKTIIVAAQNNPDVRKRIVRRLPNNE